MHRNMSDYWISEEGFHWILSGSYQKDGQESAEYAGVGIVICLSARKSIISFRQINSRLMSIKLRCPKGTFAIINAYAAHQGKPYDERSQFSHDSIVCYRSISVNDPRFIYGDLNSRLYTRFAGENDVIRNWFFSNHVETIPQDANRFLLMELCHACNLEIANSFFDHPLSKQVTYFDIGEYAMNDVE